VYQKEAMFRCCDGDVILVSSRKKRGERGGRQEGREDRKREKRGEEGKKKKEREGGRRGKKEEFCPRRHEFLCLSTS
jgi:hypothetical protein